MAVVCLSCASLQEKVPGKMAEKTDAQDGPLVMDSTGRWMMRKRGRGICLSSLQGLGLRNSQKKQQTLEDPPPLTPLGLVPRSQKCIRSRLTLILRTFELAEVTGEIPGRMDQDQRVLAMLLETGRCRTCRDSQTAGIKSKKKRGSAVSERKKSSARPIVNKLEPSRMPGSKIG